MTQTSDTPPAAAHPGRRPRFGLFYGRIEPTLFAVGFLASLALLFVGASLALNGDPGQSRTAFALLGGNLALIVVLGAFLTLRVWALLSGRTSQTAPILHRRFVTVFSLVALVPALLVGVFSTSLITQNIDDIFGDDFRDNTALTLGILNSYVNQELSTLLPKLFTIQEVVSREPRLLDNRITLTALLQRVAIEREIDSIYVLRRDGHVMARVESADTPELRIPADRVFDLLDTNPTALQTRNDHDYLMTLAPLPAREGTFVYIGDYLRENAGVLSSISGIQDATVRLDRFNANTQLLNRTFVLTYLETALLMLMAAVLIGVFLANRIIAPLGRLITASERVRGGDLGARVAVERDWGEVSDLGGAFNRMTSQLSDQRAQLIREHDLSERRRLFSEAVLGGVTAGVVSLSDEGRITAVNTSAQRLLDMRREDLEGRPLATVLPELSPAFRKAREALSRRSDDQVDIDVGGSSRTFDLRVSAYASPGGEADGDAPSGGWVLTFDDMTRLVAAQRNSAWREVARRIAHEIKNPLTPIQLSAERLQLKFRHAEGAERTVLDNCTDTILRAVGNLERMVDEFSAFARMPEPQFAPVSVARLLQASIAEQGVAFPAIDMRIEGGADPSLQVFGDQRLLGQALTNLLKNAAESVERSTDGGSLRSGQGRVTVRAESVGDEVRIMVADNGEGWPDDRERLFEPYVTTRVGGTGLGLAIVARIADDHGGRIELGNRDRGGRGAQAVLVLPLFALGSAPITQEEALA